MVAQVALIQHSVFNQRDLQEPLELGQLGMSTDECRVFMGLPATVVPASLVAGRTLYGSGGENVEILTEFTPPNVLMRTLYKPITISVPVGTTEFTLSTPSRVVMDYFAYGPDGNYDHESGYVSILNRGMGDTLLSQMSNTNAKSGLRAVTFNSASYDITTQRLTFTLNNSSTSNYTMEFVIRGWNGPMDTWVPRAD